MKLAPIFKEYLKDIEGYQSNKIENPSLTYEIYRTYSNLDNKKNNQEKTLRALENLYSKNKISDDDLYNEFLKREIRNYQNVINLFLINDEFLTKKITINNIKEISEKLLFEITKSPFNEKFTQAFKPKWDKNSQELKQLNFSGEFRQTNLQKGNIKFRPAKNIEKDLQKILDNTYKVLENPDSSIEEKIKSLALFHLNFEFIHPFAEGNGRAGRILLNMISLQFGFLPPSFGSEQYKLSSLKNISFVSPERYREIINISLEKKEKKENWSLIKLLPKEFEKYYYYALIETANWGETKKSEIKEKDIMNIFYSKYSLDEALNFHQNYNFILKQIQKIVSADLKEYLNSSNK